MNMMQLVPLFVGALAAIGVAAYALAGPSPSKASQRRLEQLRFRHSENTDTKVESQLKKAIASRRPTLPPPPSSSRPANVPRASNASRT